MEISDMSQRRYLMESDQEALRLDMKTDESIVEEQALWAGIAPGTRVADLGCGSGKTTFVLNRLVQPEGESVGIDFSDQRIDFAGTNYTDQGLSFHCRDIRDELDGFGTFDFVWIRFVLEYYRAESRDLVRRISRMLKPGGTLCLIDLDFNCMIHSGLSPRLETTLLGAIATLERETNFDPYVGRKLYSYLFDLDYKEIDVQMQAHNLIFGDPSEKDLFNWAKKIDLIKDLPGIRFDAYGGEKEVFFRELNEFVNDPRRFTYTPLIACRGRKP